MNTERKLELVEKALARVSAEVALLMEETDYTAVAVLAPEANDLNAWREELEKELEGEAS